MTIEDQDAQGPTPPPALDWRPLSELRYDDQSVLFAAPRPVPYDGWSYDTGGASGIGAVWGWQFPGKPTHFARITPPQLADGEPYIPAPPKQEVLPEPAAGGGDRRVTIGPDAENGNNRRLFVDGSQWAKIYGWDDESVEARANEIVAALSAAPSPRQLDEGVIERMARAHDEESSAQKGEPSPWTFPEALADAEWRSERVAAMRAALAAIASPLDGGGK